MGRPWQVCGPQRHRSTHSCSCCRPGNATATACAASGQRTRPAPPWSLAFSQHIQIPEVLGRFIIWFPRVIYFKDNKKGMYGSPKGLGLCGEMSRAARQRERASLRGGEKNKNKPPKSWRCAAGVSCSLRPDPLPPPPPSD